MPRDSQLYINNDPATMTKSFRELIGVQPSTASTKDSVMVIIDAQTE